MTKDDYRRLNVAGDAPLTGRTSWGIVVVTLLVCALGLLAVYAVNTYQAFGRIGRAEEVQQLPP